MKKILTAVVFVAGTSLLNPVLACDADTSNTAQANLAATDKVQQYAAAPAAKPAASTHRYIEAFE